MVYPYTKTVNHLARYRFADRHHQYCVQTAELLSIGSRITQF